MDFVGRPSVSGEGGGDLANGFVGFEGGAHGEQAECGARASGSISGVGIVQGFAEHLESATDADNGASRLCELKDGSGETCGGEPVKIGEGVF